MIENSRSNVKKQSTMELHSSAFLLWLQGKSIREVAEEIDISQHTVQNWSTAEGWTGLAADISKRATQKIAKTMASRIAAIAEQDIQISDYAIKHLMKILASKEHRCDGNPELPCAKLINIDASGEMQRCVKFGIIQMPMNDLRTLLSALEAERRFRRDAFGAGRIEDALSRENDESAQVTKLTWGWRGAPQLAQGVDAATSVVAERTDKIEVASEFLAQSEEVTSLFDKGVDDDFVPTAPTVKELKDYGEVVAENDAHVDITQPVKRANLRHNSSHSDVLFGL